MIPQRRGMLFFYRTSALNLECGAQGGEMALGDGELALHFADRGLESRSRQRPVALLVVPAGGRGLGGARGRFHLGR